MKIRGAFSCYGRCCLRFFFLLLRPHLPDRKTAWHGRTEEHRNWHQKLSNVTSEIDRKSRFERLFPATAAAAPASFSCCCDRSTKNCIT